MVKEAPPTQKGLPNRLEVHHKRAHSTSKATNCARDHLDNVTQPYDINKLII